MPVIQPANEAAMAKLPRYGEPLRAMTGKYRARNPALVMALKFFDLLGKLHPKRGGQLPGDRPLRVLIANWAHLGDVVAMLPLLQFLADQSRIGEIGVLVGSWSRCVVSELPFIDKIHCLDHFLLDRAMGSRAEKIWNFFAHQSTVVNEIRDSFYDVSIDLFTVFPPTHRLLWKAGIPVRVGFSCAGLGSYLTHPVEWTTDDEYVLTKQLRLLRPIFGAETPKALSATYPGFVPSTLADSRLTPNRRYVLMHMGPGDYRSWPMSNWLALGRALKARGRDMVFTGAKGSEAAMASQVATELGAQCVAGMLTWSEFVTSVANAAVVISVDTVTGHLAAITLLSGRWGEKFFRPNSDNAVTLTHPVGCSPCHRSAGCAEMACVKNVSTEEILSVFDRISGS